MKSPRASRHIAVLLAAVGGPLNVLLVYQRLDALLYHGDAGREGDFRLRADLRKTTISTDRRTFRNSPLGSARCVSKLS